MSDESHSESAAKTEESLPRKKPDWWRYTNASSLGIEMAIAIMLGWWSGRWVETNITHWKPWTSTIGLLFGCAAAGLAIRRTSREYLGELKAERIAKEKANAERSAGPSNDNSSPPGT